MILKEIKYNQYSLSINDLGGIYIINNKELFLIINIADLPIVNELTKELLEYYVEWKKNNINNVIENLGKIYGRNS